MNNSMTSYAFHELTRRAQYLAIDRYTWDETKLEHERFHGMSVSDTFNDLGWRFTEHGERVA